MATYRSQQKKREFQSDSESSSDEESDSEDLSWKRRKDIPPLPKPARSAIPTFGKKQPQGVKRRKTNNIWGQVVQEQNEELIFKDMSQVGVDMTKERDVESYDYKSFEKENKSLPLGQPVIVGESDDVRGRQQQAGLGSTEDDTWLLENKTDHAKSDVRERLGSRSDAVSAKDQLAQDEDNFGSKMRFNVKVNNRMSTKEVAGNIAYSLQEPKRDMIKKVVQVLGAPKAVELWQKTRDMEMNGGMMIMNNTRRRTPGGVFIKMMKGDSGVDKKDIDEIFAEERREYTREKHKRDRARRRDKKGSMEVDEDHQVKEEDVEEEMSKDASESKPEEEEIQVNFESPQEPTDADLAQGQTINEEKIDEDLEEGEIDD